MSNSGVIIAIIAMVVVVSVIVIFVGFGRGTPTSQRSNTRVDCAGTWSDWTPCKNGKRESVFTVTRPAIGAGKPCPVQTRKTEACSEKPTPDPVDWDGSKETIPAEVFFALRHYSGRCVHPFKGSATPSNNTKLVFHDGCDEDRLKFTLTSAGSLKHKTSGKCVHPFGGATNPSNDTPLVLHEGCDEHRLKFEFLSNGLVQHVASKKCVHAIKGSENPSLDTALVLHEDCDDENRLRFTRI